MGNQLSQQYDIKQQISRVGPAGCWVVKAAVVRKGEKPCSLFIWTKKDSHDGGFVFGRDRGQAQKDLNWFNLTLEFEVKQLSKLRHPTILKIMDPLVTNDHFTAFSSEPVTWNLQDLLLSASKAVVVQTEEAENHLDDLDIQAGLIQICKALEFLHSNEILHLCLMPESIFIDEKGDWKLSGFTYSRKVGERGHIDSLPYTMPPLAYFAPEVLLDEPPTILSDSFSFGALIYSIFNNAKPFTNTAGVSIYVDEVKRGVNSVANIPLSLQSKVKEMLAHDPTFRPDPKTLLISDYFNNNLVATLKSLDDLLQQNPVEKARFLKQLPTLLQQFSLKTVLKKCLPPLCEELKNPEVTMFVLPSLFWIGERISSAEFTSKVLPHLESNVFAERNPPVSLLLLLSRMDLLVSKVAEIEFLNIGNLLVRCIASKSNQVSMAACKAIPTASSKLDSTFIKTDLLPQLVLLFQQCKSVQVQGHCLICLRSFLSKLDRETALTTMFKPLLDKLTQPPEELLLLVAVIYNECASSLFDANLNSSKTLPALWRLSSLAKTKKQYSLIMRYIDEIGERVKTEKISVLLDVSEQVELEKLAVSKTVTPHSQSKLIPVALGSTPSSTPPRPSAVNVENSTATAFFGKLDQGLNSFGGNHSAPSSLSRPPSNIAPSNSNNAAAAKKLDWAEFDPL